MEKIIELRQQEVATVSGGDYMTIASSAAVSAVSFGYSIYKYATHPDNIMPVTTTNCNCQPPIPHAPTISPYVIFAIIRFCLDTCVLNILSGGIADSFSSTDNKKTR